MPARGFAQVFTSIWSDADFVALPRTAQCTYLMLLSQADLNYAGVLSLTERRWALSCRETTRDDISADLKVLLDARFVVVDEDHEELLVRSFIRNDELWKQPRMLGVALREALATGSAGVREALAGEMYRISEAAEAYYTGENDAERLAELQQRLRETATALLGGPEPPPDAAPLATPREGIGQGTRARAGAAAAPAPTPTTTPGTGSGTSRANERSDVTAARLAARTLPRGMSRSTLEKLVATLTRRADAGAPWDALEHALQRWTKRSDVTPFALDWMVDDALKDKDGARRGGKPTTDDRVASALRFLQTEEEESSATIHELPQRGTA